MIPKRVRDMKFRITGFELVVRDADPYTAIQRISAVHDRDASGEAPQLQLTLAGADVIPMLKKGMTIEIIGPK